MACFYTASVRGFSDSFPRMCFLIFFVLVACPLWGQALQKRAMTAADYPLWESMSAGHASDDGQWVFYQVFSELADTLYVKKQDGNKTYQFAGGRLGQFLDGGHFGCIDSGDSLRILNLDTGKRVSLPDAVSYSAADKRLGVVHGDSTLAVYDRQGKLLHRHAGVQLHLASRDKKNSAITTREADRTAVYLVNTSGKPGSMAITSDADGGAFSRLKWSPDGNKLLFLGYGKHTTLYCYNLLNRQLYSIDDRGSEDAIFGRMEIMFSRDGRYIFYNSRPPQKGDPKTDLQVWHAADKLLPIAKPWSMRVKLMLWEPAKGRILPITTNQYPQGFLTGGEQHAVLYDPDRYEPQSNFFATRDLHLMDLATGSQRLLLKEQDGEGNHLVASMGGRFIAYFRERDWHVYDIKKGTHTNITRGLGTSFDDTGFDRAGDFPAWGIAGWTDADQALLVYDAHDLWKIAPDGTGAQRLTNGRESGTVFRIVPQVPLHEDEIINHGMWSGLFEMKQGLVLHGRSGDYLESGIYFHNGTKLRQVYKTRKRIYGVTKARDSDSFYWLEETYSQPTQLVVRPGKGPTRVLASCNGQAQQYLPQHLEVIRYLSPKGKPLRGLLYYPAGYEPVKQYPMVVSLYETQSNELHHYLAPGLNNGLGFNARNLSTKGYFVLLPDIAYEMGKIGESALGCVTAAVQQALKTNAIDPARIGLTGHSFGGFETNYIIARSELFACAVSGAAVNNQVSNYLSVARYQKRPNFFKVEFAQARMGKSLYADMGAYLRNSPVLLADRINTPLLSWTGLEDHQVEWTQSFEMYMALRRLGKTHVLLAYPQEAHSLVDAGRSTDLTLKTEAWFDHYLKDMPAEEWMLPK